MISRFSRDSCRCRLSTRLASLASISSWTNAAAVVKPTDNPPLAGGQAQTESDMGLAGAAVTDGNDILAARDVFTAGQLHYQGLVHRGDGREVEGVQALHGGKACRPDPTLHHELVAVAMSSSWANRSRYSG